MFPSELSLEKNVSSHFLRVFGLVSSPDRKNALYVFFGTLDIFRGGMESENGLVLFAVDPKYPEDWTLE